MCKISIIGRSNVGKSTLFNKLIKFNKSLISDIPETTRDRRYGEYIYNNNRKIIIIDTGSLINNNNILYKNIYNQTIKAIIESNIVFFVIEYNNGIINDDYIIFKILKEYNKRIILLVNKIDIKNINKYHNFFSLNIKELYFISAKYNIGLKQIFNFISKNFSKKEINLIKNNVDINIKIIIIGKSNVGKSTLINKITKTDRLIVSNYFGTTLENIDICLIKKNTNFILTDTSGIDNNINNITNNFKISLNNIKYNKLINTNIVIFVINITEDFSNKEISIINNINKLGKIIILIVNKIDLKNFKEIFLFKDIIKKKLSFLKNIKIFYISALYNKNFDYLIKYIYNLYEISNKKFKTKEINNILKEAISNKLPKLNFKLFRSKIKYAYIINNPLKLIIHGSKVNYIDKNYRKYLLNFFINKLNIQNIPIKIIFKEN